MGFSLYISVQQTSKVCTDRGPLPAADRRELGMSKSLVETAREAGSFTTLLEAVDAAGLEDTLAGGGPFTVFAPSDELEASNGLIHVIDRVLLPAAA
jgi:uncharacterized surface protein with fasciclin (FAS1) repeats